MKTLISDNSSTEKKIDVVLPQEEITALFDEKIEAYRKKITMPGFRPGKKIPKNLVVSQYGAHIHQEAVEELIDAGLKEELKKAEIDPIAYGAMTDLVDEKDKDMTFSLMVEIDPEIEVKDYDNLGVSAEAVSLDPGEVDKIIADMQRQTAKQNEVDRASEKGDIIVGKYLNIAVDGKEDTLPENPEFQVEIGASDTDYFDEGLIGLKAGDTKVVEFSYPEDYKNEAMRGKKAEFNVSVSAVKVLELSELNDEFAKIMGAKDMADLKEKLEENLLKQKEQESKAKAHEEVLKILVEKNKFDVPNSRVKHYISYMMNQNVQKEEDRVVPTDEQIEEGREGAVFEIKKTRILDLISKEAKIKSKQKDVDAKIKDMSAMYGMEFDQFKKMLRESGRIENLREEIKIEKTLDFLIGIRD